MATLFKPVSSPRRAAYPGTAPCGSAPTSLTRPRTRHDCRSQTPMLRKLQVLQAVLRKFKVTTGPRIRPLKFLRTATGVETGQQRRLNSVIHRCAFQLASADPSDIPKMNARSLAQNGTLGITRAFAGDPGVNTQRKSTECR